MADLVYYIDSSGGKAGFLLPVFREVRGSNYDLLQAIGSNGLIVDFHKITPRGNSCLNLSLEYKDAEKYKALIGGPSIWAFRDHNGNIHTGTESYIIERGFSVLGNGIEIDNSIFAFELYSFCNEGGIDPHLAIKSYDEKKLISIFGADIWRDTEIFLTSIKMDLRNYYRSAKSIPNPISKIIVSTSNDTVHIYAPFPIPQSSINLPRFERLFQAFRLREYVFHEISGKNEVRKVGNYDWILFGIGGVANNTITNAPFFGGYRNRNNTNPQLSPEILIARGNHENGGRKISIAIFNSNHTEAQKINSSSRFIAPRGALLHSINIRPIGYGTPNPRKLPISEIPSVLNRFDYVWIVSNHKQRRKPAMTSLSASSKASFFAKSAADGLIYMAGNPETSGILSKISNDKGYGLVGASRIDSTITMKTMIKRVLATMICEDAHLHTAKEIFCLWPGRLPYSSHEFVLDVGEYQYNINILNRIQSKRISSVVAFATDVKLSKKTQSDFAEFCTTLVSFHDYELTDKSTRYATFNYLGQKFTIFPSTSQEDMDHIILTYPPAGENLCIIVINGTIPSFLRNTKFGNGFFIMHYSDILDFLSDKVKNISYRLI